MRVLGLVVLIGLCLPLLLFGQETPETFENPALDAILDDVLELAEDERWDEALALLDEAEALDAADPRIASYRRSVRELRALDAVQDAWAEGVAREFPDEGDNGEDGPPRDEPKFVLDRAEYEARTRPAATRDRLRFNVNLKTLAVDPLGTGTYGTWSSANEFFYTSLGADFYTWLPYLGRSLGFHIRSGGYSWVPGEPILYFNTLDGGVNLRGFLLESETSRMEIGLDFGAAMQSSKERGAGVDRSGALFLGLWLSDPVFYHLFDAESLENFLIGGGLRVYSSLATDEQLLQTIGYRLDGSWLFPWGQIGTRLSWWDFAIDVGRTNVLAVEVFGGIRF